jgi:hypothetical protein
MDTGRYHPATNNSIFCGRPDEADEEGSWRWNGLCKKRLAKEEVGTAQRQLVLMAGTVGKRAAL